MLTETEYKKYRKLYDRKRAWVGNRTSWKTDEEPKEFQELTNDKVSAVEVYEFVHDPPDRYFVYIDEEKALATTWTGDKLGTVHFGRPYVSNFGDERTPVDMAGINGIQYHGTYYRSSGDYARIKKCKNQETR